MQSQVSTWDSCRLSGTYSSKPLHSDVCGKMGTKLIGVTDYFHTINEKICYVWVYPLKQRTRYTASSQNGNGGC